MTLILVTALYLKKGPILVFIHNLANFGVQANFGLQE